jgi:Exostosin family
MQMTSTMTARLIDDTGQEIHRKPQCCSSAVVLVFLPLIVIFSLCGEVRILHHGSNILGSVQNQLSVGVVFANLTLENQVPNVVGINIPSDNQIIDSVSSSTLESKTTLSLLLRVPFYIYDNPEFQWHTNATTVRKRDDTNATLPYPEWFRTNFLPQGDGNPKHSDDYWFLQSALRHPMRVHDPEQAKLFIVPTMLNSLMHNLERFCYMGKCWEELVKVADDTLGQSPYFQRRQGKDHLLVASHSNPKKRLPKGYDSKKKSWTKYYPHLTSCNILGYYDLPSSRFNSYKRLFLPKHYVSAPCQPMPGDTATAILQHKTHDLAMISKMYTSTDGIYKDRHNICQWILGQDGVYNDTYSSNSVSTTTATASPTFYNLTMPICGRGSQCPALAQAKYGFHVRGDKLGSNRLADTILSGSVPIFTLEDQYKVLPQWIDWSQLSYLARADMGRDVFLQDMEEILRDDSYAEKLQNVLANRDVLDWKNLDALVPFDMYLYQLSLHVYPDDDSVRWNATTTRSKYSSIIL